MVHTGHTSGTVSCRLSSLLFPLSAEKLAGWFQRLLSQPFFCMEKGTSDPHPVPLIVPFPLGLAGAWQAKCSGAILLCRCLPVLDLPAGEEAQQCKVASTHQCSSLLAARAGRSPPTPPLHEIPKDEGAWERGWPSLGEDRMFPQAVMASRGGQFSLLFLQSLVVLLEANPCLPRHHSVVKQQSLPAPKWPLSTPATKTRKEDGTSLFFLRVRSKKIWWITPTTKRKGIVRCGSGR